MTDLLKGITGVSAL